MNMLLNQLIGEYIVEYDPEYSEGNYQFAGLIIKDSVGNEISLINIDQSSVSEEELELFKQLLEKINRAVGDYFYKDQVEDFIVQKFNLPVNGVNIEIESI